MNQKWTKNGPKMDKFQANSEGFFWGNSWENLEKILVEF